MWEEAMAELSEQACLEDFTLNVPEGEKPTPVSRLGGEDTYCVADTITFGLDPDCCFCLSCSRLKHPLWKPSSTSPVCTSSICR